MLEHQRRVAVATRPVDALRTAMHADLDEVDGGFGWWRGYPDLDPAKLIFASDYLVQIAGQAGRLLTRAAWDEHEFEQNWYAETSWLRRHGQVPDGRTPFRDEAAQKRDERIDVSVGGFFVNCGSVLDALAGAAIGVLALRADLVTAAWASLTAAAGPAGRDRDRLLAPAGTVGRQVQDDALGVIAAAIGAGPHGWLSWTLSMRNMLVHRAHRFRMRRSYRPARRGDGFDHVLHLPRNPQLTDAEAFILGSRLEDLVLWEHAGVTMAGIREHLVELVAAVARELERLWVRRRGDPVLLDQPAAQWKSVYPTRRDLSQFAGFGSALPEAAAGELRVGGDVARRMRAARVTDRHREFWIRTFADGG